MNNKEKVYCEKCGTEMEPFHKMGSCGYSCPKCGWGWATTYYSPLDLDKQKYTISVSSSSQANSASYKAVSKLMNCNYLEARKKMASGFIFKDVSAKETMLILKELASVQLEYSVDPQYPHDLSEY